MEKNQNGLSGQDSGSKSNLQKFEDDTKKKVTDPNNPLANGSTHRTTEHKQGGSETSISKSDTSVLEEKSKKASSGMHDKKGGTDLSKKELHTENLSTQKGTK